MGRGGPSPEMDRQEFVEAVIAELSLKDMTLPLGQAKQRSPQELADDLCMYDFVSPNENEMLELSKAVRCLSSCGENEKLLNLRLTRKYWNGLLYLSGKGDSVTPSYAEAVAELSATSIVHLVEHLLMLPHEGLSAFFAKYEPLSLEQKPENTCTNGSLDPDSPLDIPVDTAPLATNDVAIVHEEIIASTPDDDDFVYEGDDIHDEEDYSSHLHSDLVLNSEYHLATNGREMKSEELMECLSDILNMVNYSMIAGLSSSRWESLELTETISRIMGLFLGRGKATIGILSSGDNTKATAQYMCKHLCTYAYLLRDRAEHRKQDASLCLPPLLNLVQNQLLPQLHMLPSTKRVIATETVVGLTALGSVYGAAVRETASSSTLDSKATEIYRRQIDTILPAIVDCFDVILTNESQQCFSGMLMPILRFYAGICLDGTAVSYPSIGLFKAGVHRVLLQLVLKTRAIEHCFTRTLLILSAQSADIALFVAGSAPTVQLLEDVVLEGFPIEGLAWMAILAHAKINRLPPSSQTSETENSTSRISMACENIKRMSLSPSVLLDGLQVLHCARHRLGPWLSSGAAIPSTISATLREALEGAAALNSELSSSTDAIPLEADDVLPVNEQEEKVKLQKAKRLADIARSRRYLKELLDLVPSKGD